jgi:hypothetical protein
MVALFAEVQGLVQRQRLEPAVRTQYMRTAWQADTAASIRVPRRAQPLMAEPVDGSRARAMHRLSLKDSIGHGRPDAQIYAGMGSRVAVRARACSVRMRLVPLAGLPGHAALHAGREPVGRA